MKLLGVVSNVSPTSVQAISESLAEKVLSILNYEVGKHNTVYSLVLIRIS